MAKLSWDEVGPASAKGFQYDFFAEEWDHICGACGKIFFTPTQNDMKYAVNKHITSEECLGGW